MIVYDTAALIAGERGDPVMWAIHDDVLRDRLSPLVPAGVLAQAWRGGPQHNLARLLAGCLVMPLDETLARAAGTLCGRAKTTDIVDAAIVILAHATGSAIVSGDAADLRHLAEAVGADIAVQAI